MSGGWPDEALIEQAPSIGPAVLRLIDSEERWVHRRVERLELPNAAQVTRTVATDFTVPVGLQDELALWQVPNPPAGTKPDRFVVPLGVLPKGPLQDVTFTPSDVHRLTANQSTPLALAAITPFARLSGAPPDLVLRLAKRIIRSESARKDLLDQLHEQLANAQGGDPAARERLKGLLRTLNANYLLLVVVKAVSGMPGRVSYLHRQTVQAAVGHVNDSPLVIEPALPYASGPGPPYRVEVSAPDGLEIETASLVSVEQRVRRPLVSENTEAGEGAFVHLRAPDSEERPDRAALQVRFGWLPGGIQHLGAIAGLTSTAALLAATLISYALDEKMKGSAASTLLAAPALVTSLALGFATTRVTLKAANRLRIAAFCTALLGIAGGLTVSLLGENAEQLNVLHGVLIGCTAVSLLITCVFPLRAALRKRASVDLIEEA